MKETRYNQAKRLFRFVVYMLLPLVGGGWAGVSCSDTWDEHYESLSGGVHEGSLWQAIEQNPDLSNFASVVRATGYDKSLGSSQVFTVFAPTNASFSKEEADVLIKQYNIEKAQRVNDDDNTVIKEFVQNHIALYNYSVSSLSNDSISMMNGKYAVLHTENLNGVRMLSKNNLYENGVLYTLAEPVTYLPNVFEYVRTASDLDSLRSFLYNSHFYYKTFQPSLSVAGGIVDGKTVYLDSVFTQNNELFDYLGLINTEDSTYWMVAPTNDVWNKLVEEYESYFNYAANVSERDSLFYTNVRLAIVDGTSFSRTFNTDNVLKDSAMSNSCMRQYNYRESMWGAPFHYYQYDDPLRADGIFGSATAYECSNGRVYKASQWAIDKLSTFARWNIIEAEGSSSIKEITKTLADNKVDTVYTTDPSIVRVSSDNMFYDRIWNHCIEMFTPAKSNLNHTITFNITDVLSNFGYDIYLVTAPALAVDSNATDAQRLPNKLRCTLKYPGGPVSGDRLLDKYDTHPDEVDYILLAEDFKFPVCTYGLREAIPSTTLEVTTQPTNTETRAGKYTRLLFLDCILLVPHGTMIVEENQVMMYPHGFTERPNSFWSKIR